MTRNTFPLRLTGARVLRDDGFQDDALGLSGGLIEDGPWSEVDLSGYLVLPGIIDMHGDAFERHVSPRLNTPFPVEMGLASTDRDAASCGVTTAWMAQSWSWEGGVRAPDYAETMLAALARYRDTALTDLHVQIRCETHTVETAERLINAVTQHKIRYVVFNNHLDEAVMLARKSPQEIAVWAKNAGRTPGEHMARVEAALEAEAQVPRFLCTLANAFDKLGIRYGSHDDPDGETRERFSLIGARICEFPLSIAAARAAHAVDDPVIMGAPNVVRGGSRSGNVAATELARLGHCDVLVSDYYYPSLAAAAFQLADLDLYDFADAWAMISTRPAEIMGLQDRGRLAEGLRADVTVVDPATRQVEMTFVKGRLTYLAGGAAARLLEAAPRAALAAE